MACCASYLVYSNWSGRQALMVAGNRGVFVCLNLQKVSLAANAKIRREP